MSLYRAVRAGALLVFFKKYQSKVLRIAAAAGVIVVVSWLYGDIASYLQLQRPNLSGPALAIRLLVTLCALLYIVWQFLPDARIVRVRRFAAVLWHKLLKVGFALGVALFVHWQYGDVAQYLVVNYPGFSGGALAAKTAIVIAAALYALWQLRPGSWGVDDAGLNDGATSAGDAPPPNEDAAPAGEGAAPQGPLDALMDKPKLQSYEDAILSKPPSDPPPNPARDGG